ncbi:MAG: DMT family transporter [Sphingomonadales bacterium]|nr:DMT family transporter [Sphingomonadales bacterium]MBU3993999.1 DMT family transporter [Alphaproteobacteria bacterium]
MPIANRALLLGPAWMLASIFANTTELVLIHWLGPGWPAPVQLFWRQASALLLLSPLIIRAGSGAFRTKTWKIVLFRSVCAMLGLGTWIYASTHLPLATATTLSFTRPLWIVILARLLLGEQVSLIKWGAVGLGFCGVLVMVQPGASGGAALAQGAAIASSLLFAMSFVSIKSMAADNNPLVIMVWSCLLGVLFSAPPAALMWRVPSPGDALVLGGLGLASLAAFACMLKAMSFSGAAALMPMDYLRLPLITVVGIVLFNEHPGVAALGGAGLIVLSALATAIGDRKARQATA